MGRVTRGLRHSLQALYNKFDGLEARTSGAAAITLDTAFYKSEITSGGTAGSEDVNLGDGTGIEIGERKLVEFTVETNAADVLNLDHANMVNAAGTAATNVDLTGVGDSILFEWNGTAWQVVYNNGGTVAP